MASLILKVTYTVRPDYVAHNSANIQQVMQDLQALGNPGITYFACFGADGKTFTHTAFFQSEAEQKALFALPAFQNFQTELRGSQPEVPPQQELLVLVGSAGAVFSW